MTQTAEWYRRHWQRRARTASGALVEAGVGGDDQP